MSLILEKGNTVKRKWKIMYMRGDEVSKVEKGSSI